MTQEFDAFCIGILNDALWFLEKAESSTDAEASAAHIHAALLLGFAALEAHINAVAEELAQRTEFTVHERGLLLEQGVRLEKGEYQLTGSLQMSRLEDRVQFLHRRFTGQPSSGTLWWSALRSGIDLRNSLTHPKAVSEIQPDAVRRILQAIVDALDALYQAIYKRPYPPSRRGLISTRSF